MFQQAALGAAVRGVAEHGLKDIKTDRPISVHRNRAVALTTAPADKGNGSREVYARKGNTAAGEIG